jgi:AraC-like DNA-binding protein
MPGNAGQVSVLARRYARVVTPEEFANLAHLRRARDLMDREYARPLDVAALARAALMSTAHFSRQFRATYGETPYAYQTPYAYLMTRRIERARHCCAAATCRSPRSAWRSGAPLGSFSARFTQLVGETPSAYRARDHSALASVPGLRRQGSHPPKAAGRAGSEKRGRRWLTSVGSSPSAPAPSPASRSSSRTT